MSSKCVDANVQLADTMIPRFRYQRETDYWVPTRGMLEKFTPMRLEGYWAVEGKDQRVDGEEINRLTRSPALEKLPFRIAVGGYEQFHPHMWKLLKSMPLCTRGNE